MALWPYALRTVAAAKAALTISGAAIDSLVEDCVNDASQMVEGAWGAELVSRGSVTEFYTFECREPDGHVLVPNQGPIVSITNLWEDVTRAYATPLVAGTDYLVSQPATEAYGRIIRVASSLAKPWAVGWRSVKVTGFFGFQNTAGTIAGAQGVHPSILGVFDELVAWMVRHRAKREAGVQSQSDGTGSHTFWTGPPMVTEGMRARLRSAGALRPSLRGCHGERDA